MSNFFSTAAKNYDKAAIKELKDCVDKIERRLTNMEDCCNQLNDQNDQLKSEHYKDNELRALAEKNAKLEAKINEMRRYSFEITKEENDSIEAWMKQHEKEKHHGVGIMGCSGGAYTYIFTPTGLGTDGVVKCICGESFRFQEIG